MTEAVYTHKPAAMCKHGRRAFAFSPRDVARDSGLAAFAVDTHEFQPRCPLTEVQFGPASMAGVHAYPQSRLALELADHTGAALLPAGATVVVYTYKQGANSRHAAGCPGSVYTYKQRLVPGGQWSPPPRGELSPPTVYTHKHPQTNPAQSGVRCVWGLKTGAPP